MAEADDFPIVCERCLGKNPYVRMIRVPNGASCRISNVPFTVHRWTAPGAIRERETIICRDVATAKNVCQSCLHDLEYNVPSHVVDSLLRAVDGPDTTAASDANRDFFYDQQSRDVAEGRVDGSAGHGKLAANIDRLERIASMAPYRNPYKHGPGDVPAPRPRRERRGRDEEVAGPANKAVTTLFVAGVPPSVTEAELTRHFNPFGALRSVKMDMDRLCARVTYHDRNAAEAAVRALYDNLSIDGTRLRVMWARGRGEGGEGGGSGGGGGGSAAAAAVPKAPPGIKALPPGVQVAAYPSSRPEAADDAGARLDLDRDG